MSSPADDPITTHPLSTGELIPKCQQLDAVVETWLETIELRRLSPGYVARHQKKVKEVWLLARRRNLRKSVDHVAIIVNIGRTKRAEIINSVDLGTIEIEEIVPAPMI